MRGEGRGPPLTKGLARLGDSLINFVCSAAASLEGGRPRGIRVKNEILSKAAKELRLKEELGLRGVKLKGGDLVEALLAYVWLKGALSLEDMIRIARRGFSASEGDLEGRVFGSVVALLRELLKASKHKYFRY